MKGIWIPIRGSRRVEVIKDIEVIVYPDQKFGCASLKVNAITTSGNRIRILTKTGRGLGIKGKKGDIRNVFAFLVGAPIRFQLFESPDGCLRMYFPSEEDSQRIAPAKKKAETFFLKAYEKNLTHTRYP